MISSMNDIDELETRMLLGAVTDSAVRSSLKQL